MTKTHTANDLNQQLQELAIQARLNPAKSLKRRQKLNEIVRLVTKSNKLWQENTPYYKDALQQTWLYFCRNIEQYDPSRCSVITWLNNCLKWRLQDYCKAEAKKRATTISPSQSTTGEIIDPINKISASPEMPPILEETYQWVQTDLDQELRNTHVKGHPNVTCQILILRRLPPEVPWKDIAQEFNLPLSTAPNFYKRECLPRLRNFARRQGYLT
jgi:DNA polymerase III psi subunit